MPTLPLEYTKYKKQKNKKASIRLCHSQFEETEVALLSSRVQQHAHKGWRQIWSNPHTSEKRETRVRLASSYVHDLEYADTAECGTVWS